MMMNLVFLPLSLCTWDQYYCAGNSTCHAPRSTVQHRLETGHDIDETLPVESNVYASFTVDERIDDVMVYLYMCAYICSV